MPPIEPILRSPLVNAAGTLGFSPNPRGPVDLARLGAFLTNPISLAPRTPAETRAALAYPGGLLLHSGLPNPGLRETIKRHAQRWARSSLPIIVHLIPASAEEVARMVMRLEGLEGVLGVEVGLPPGISVEEAGRLARAAQGELPVWVCLPMDRAAELAPALLAVGTRIVSFQPPRGMLPGLDGGLVSGRLYGPAVFPLALAALRLARAAGFEVVAGGGVYSAAQTAVMLAAGASLVALDTVLWSGLEQDHIE